MPRFFRNRPASRVLPLRPGAGGAVRLAPPAGRSVLAPGRSFLAGRSSRRGLSSAPMSEVTRVLSAIERGDPHAAGQLLPLVYDELRRLAAGERTETFSGPASGSQVPSGQTLANPPSQEAGNSL